MASKILTIILLRRLSATRETSCREEQAEFRSGRGCTDQIFVLRQILEIGHCYNRPLILVFLDIRAAFDTVHRESLWQCLKHNGIPERFLDLLRSLYEHTNGRVRVYNEYSASFPITNGVRQGCPMSPFLFNFVVDDVLSRAFASGEAGIDFLPGTRIRDLDYADDIVIFGDNPRILQTTLDKLTF